MLPGNDTIGECEAIARLGGKCISVLAFYGSQESGKVEGPTAMSSPFCYLDGRGA